MNSNVFMDMENVMFAYGIMETPGVMRGMRTPDEVLWETPGILVTEGIIWSVPVLVGTPPAGLLPLHPTGMKGVWVTAHNAAT